LIPKRSSVFLQKRQCILIMGVVAITLTLDHYALRGVGMAILAFLYFWQKIGEECKATLTESGWE
jgi:hypothetical protein